MVEKHRAESMFLPNMTGGGLIGLLIGIIGGLLGMRVGQRAVPRVAVRSGRHEETESALGAISGTVQVGRTSLLAVVTEQSPEVVDAAMSELGGTVLRRTVGDVEVEIAAAEDVERKAKWQARNELARSHREHNKAAVDAKLDQLKVKLSRGQKTPA